MLLLQDAKPQCHSHRQSLKRHQCHQKMSALPLILQYMRQAVIFIEQAILQPCAVLHGLEHALRAVQVNASTFLTNLTTETET